MHYFQRTVSKPVTCTGIGVHSGRTVTTTIKPAPTNHGIKFIRTDLPDHPGITAHFNRVVDTSLATVIGSDGFIVSTIEHVMATFSGLAIDNAIVEVNDYELPMMDGSAGPFTESILSAGVRTQEMPRCYFVVKDPIEYRENGRSVCIYPADTYKITYTIEFDHPLIATQTYTIDMSGDGFASEISPARTFGFLHEVEYLRRFGFARGGSLDNAIVVDTDCVLNDGGLRFTDEFVRHKILDCIGDFSLLGMPILGHVVAHKSGHQFNHAFLEQFFAHRTCWQTCTPCPASLEQPLSQPVEPKALAI